MTAGLVMTVSCNDDDVSPVLEERVLVKEINLEAVSYTHLDVYKRQLLYRENSISIKSLWNRRTRI